MSSGSDVLSRDKVIEFADIFIKSKYSDIDFRVYHVVSNPPIPVSMLVLYQRFSTGGGPIDGGEIAVLVNLHTGGAREFRDEDWSIE